MNLKELQRAMAEQAGFFVIDRTFRLEASEHAEHKGLVVHEGRLNGKPKTRSAFVDCTQAEFDAWQGGELIQNAMPRASAEKREFCKTAMTPEEWDNATLPPEEEGGDMGCASPEDWEEGGDMSPEDWDAMNRDL